MPRFRLGRGPTKPRTDYVFIEFGTVTQGGDLNGQRTLRTIPLDAGRRLQRSVGRNTKPREPLSQYQRMRPLVQKIYSDHSHPYCQNSAFACLGRITLRRSGPSLKPA